MKKILVFAACLLLWPLSIAAGETGGGRPNILWITCEDMGPHLGCYGDAYATTPRIDRLAQQSLRYTRVWSCAPVCAPARTTLISGLYPTSTGAEHMRSITRLPPGLHMYPHYLREAGYYCTNNAKEDYNLERSPVCWNESSAKAHYKNRAAGQPFFAVFNITITHESQIRGQSPPLVHDPAQASLPPYHPDTSSVRADWARYYDNISRLDAAVGERLDELERAGLAENTIVFFYSDHGSGMPRSKRTAQNSGLHVPLLVRVPAALKHLAPSDYAAGGATDRLCSFVDFAPTALSLAGVKPPEQWQGRAFLGKFAAEPQAYVFGFRGRMDERLDCVRACRDARYSYVQNFMPHLPKGQHVAYQFLTKTTTEWKALFDAGKLNEVQAAFWLPKAPEELYDLQSDPHETKNLAADAAHSETLARMRLALRQHLLAVRDVGLLPEAEMHARSAGRTPYELGHDAQAYPLERILETAELAASSEPAHGELQKRLSDTDSGVRYWAAMGLLMRGERELHAAQELKAALNDASPSVRIAAAEALARFGPKPGQAEAVNTLVQLSQVEHGGSYAVIAALNALDRLPRNLVAPHLDTLRARGGAKPEKRYAEYPQRLLEHLTQP